VESAVPILESGLIQVRGKKWDGTEAVPPKGGTLFSEVRRQRCPPHVAHPSILPFHVLVRNHETDFRFFQMSGPIRIHTK